MTAPVRTLGVKFSADGSESVRRAIAQVAAAAKTAADTAARAAAAAARQIAETQQSQAMAWQRGVQAAERAAYAEQAIRDTAAARARATIERSSAAQMAAAQQTATTVRDKYGMMALSVSSAFNQMAFAGKTTGEGMRNIVVQTAMVATSIFGKGGPWGAAISVGLLTLSTLYSSAKAEQREFEAEWKESLKRMVDAGDQLGMRAAAEKLWQGTASKEFKDGLGPRLEALKLPFATVDVLEQEIERANMLAKVRVEGMRARHAELLEVIELRKRYDELVTSMTTSTNALPSTRPTAPITFSPAAATLPRRGPAAPGASATQLGWQGERYRGLVEGRGATALPQNLQMDPKDFAQSAAAAAKRAAELSTRTREEILEQFRKDQSALSNGIAETLAGGIAAGIATAVTSGDIGQAIRGMASTILAGLGDVFAQIAAKAIMEATLMKSFMEFLTVNPLIALAAATAMMTLARGMGGRPSGSRGGYTGAVGGAAAAAGQPAETTTRIIFGQNSLAVAAGMTPRQALNVTIIGPDDPNAQRGIQELLRKSNRRGDL